MQSLQLSRERRLQTLALSSLDPNCSQDSSHQLCWKSFTLNLYQEYPCFPSLSLQVSVKSWYLPFFNSYTSSTLSFHGTFSSICIIHFRDLDHITVWPEVRVCHFLSELQLRSTNISQLLATYRLRVLIDVVDLFLLSPKKI